MSNIDAKDCAKVVFTRERFLSNNDNKSNFIKLLAKKLTEESHSVKICKGDANTAIVSTTLKTARMSKKMVVAVADDTDIAVMLLYNWKEHHGDIVFFQPRWNRGWDIKFFAEQCDPFREHLLLIHAWSGCDTTSAPFGKGKINFLNSG